MSLMRGFWRTQPDHNNRDVWLKRLEGFVQLEKVVVVCDGFPSGQIQDLATQLKSLVNAVIVRNASTLTTIDCVLLPFDPKPEPTHDHNHPILVYVKPQDLSCNALSPAAATACPQLVRLKAGPLSAVVMQNLPHATMQYLHVKCNTRRLLEVVAFMAAVSRMTHLKELKVAYLRDETGLSGMGFRSKVPERRGDDDWKNKNMSGEEFMIRLLDEKDNNWRKNAKQNKERDV